MEVVLTMVVYFGNAVISVYCSKYAYQSKYKVNRRIAYIIMLAIPTLIATYRGYTGSDSKMYIDAYNHLDYYVLMRYNGFEEGFQILIRALNLFHMPYQVLFLIMSFFTTFFFMKFVENEKEYIDVKIATLIYSMDLFLFSMNAMRQAFAITIVLYALSKYLDGEKLKGLLLITIGSSFHFSAWLGIIVVIVKYIFESKRYKTFIFLTSVVGIFLIENRQILGNLAAIFSNDLYAQYILSDFGSTSTISNFLIKNGLVILLMFLSDFSEYKKMRFYFGLCIIGYILTGLAIVTGTQAQRIGYNYMYLNTVVMAFCASHDCVRLKKLYIKKEHIRSAIIIFTILFCINNYFVRGNNQIVPYLGFSNMK